MSKNLIEIGALHTTVRMIYYTLRNCSLSRNGAVALQEKLKIVFYNKATGMDEQSQMMIGLSACNPDL
ncbi:MAG: hypothetical protein ACPG8W_12925 [Candidatus Promineifilaceae bacterium]